MCIYCGKKDEEDYSPSYIEEEDIGPYFYNVFIIGNEEEYYIFKSDIRVLYSNKDIFQKIKDFIGINMNLQIGIYRIDPISKYDYIYKEGKFIYPSGKDSKSYLFSLQLFFTIYNLSTWG